MSSGKFAYIYRKAINRRLYSLGHYFFLVSGSCFNPCDTHNGGCSHMCLRGYNNFHSCACPEGMVLWMDNRTCGMSFSSCIHCLRRTAMFQIKESITFRIQNHLCHTSQTCYLFMKCSITHKNAIFGPSAAS